MKLLNEEKLNAYVDGALDADARAEVEALLEADPEARALLQKLRGANALAIEAFAEPMHEAPPRALIDTILGADIRGTRTVHSAVTTGKRPRALGVQDYALPLAAVLALAVGISAGVFLGRQIRQPPEQLALGPVPAGSTLHRLLEGGASGSAFASNGTRGAGRLSVLATFRDRHSRPCREIEAGSSATDQRAVAAAVACRNVTGQWVLEGATRLAGAQDATASQFEPSGVPEKDALEGLLTMLGAQQALSPAEEKALIERGWKN